MKILKDLRRFQRCYNGVAVLEFALILPLLIVMFVATVEIVRLAIIHEKVRVASHTVGDLLTRSSTATLAGLTAYANAVDPIIMPFSFDGTVIFTSVASSSASSGGGPGLGAASFGGSRSSSSRSAAGERRCVGGCIVWQEEFKGNHPSKIGTVGERAKLPPGFRMDGRQNLIIVEIFYNFSPILPFTQSLINSLAAQVTYSAAIFKPRQESLIEEPL